MSHRRVIKRQRAGLPPPDDAETTTSRTRTTARPRTTRRTSSTAMTSLSVNTRAAIVSTPASDALSSTTPASATAPAAAAASTSAAPTIVGLKAPIFIAIVAAAGVVLLVVLGLITFCCCKRRKAKKMAATPGWSKLDSPPRRSSLDEKQDLSAEGASGNLSFSEERRVMNAHNAATPRAPPTQQHGGYLSPYSVPTPTSAALSQDLLSPSTPNSAQLLLRGGPPSPGFGPNSYAGFYHPPPSASLRPPGQEDRLAPTGAGRGDESPNSMPGEQQYGMAISSGLPDPSPYLSQTNPNQIPWSSNTTGEPLRLADPPEHRKKRSLDPNARPGDNGSYFPQLPSDSTLSQAHTQSSAESLTAFTALPKSNSAKNFGQANAPIWSQLEHSRLSVHSEMGELAGGSPANSPSKPLFPNPAVVAPSREPLHTIQEASVEMSSLPDVIVRSDSRQEGEHYVFGQPSPEEVQVARKVSIKGAEQPHVLDRQGTLAATRKDAPTKGAAPFDALSPASRSEAQFNVGQAILHGSLDSSSADFLPSLRDSSMDTGTGFLTLQQMAMQQQHADFNDYRCPTYSIYGAYAVD